MDRDGDLIGDAPIWQSLVGGPDTETTHFTKCEMAAASLPVIGVAGAGSEVPRHVDLSPTH